MSEYNGKFDYRKNQFAGGILEAAAQVTGNEQMELKGKIQSTYWLDEKNMGNHQIFLHAQESLPEIHSIKKIGITIVMGRIIMQLDDQGEKVYSPGIVIDVPIRTKMKIKNRSSYKTAIFVMK